MAAAAALVVRVNSYEELRRWWNASEPAAVVETPAPLSMTEAILSYIGEADDTDDIDITVDAEDWEWEQARLEWAQEQPTKEVPAPLLYALQGRSVTLR